MTPGSLTMTALGARRRGARLVAVVVTLLFCLVWLVLGGSRRACADSYVSEDGNWTYELDADGNATITDYLGFDSTVVIPPDYESGTIDGHPVVAVGDDALFDDKTVEELWLYDPVVSLGGMAFYGCSSLKEVYFNCDGLTEIPAYCFYGCSSLESISIPGNVKHIGNGAFEGCASLSDVSFLVGSESKGLTIDARAFAGCTRLESITLPSTLDTLSDDVFNGCTSLGAVTFLGIPSSLGASVFSGCSALHSVYIPSGFSFVPDIEAPAGTAFLFFSYDNSGFAEIENTYDNDVAQAHIPSMIGSHEVRSIGGMAFANCTRLTSVVFPDDCNVQTIGEQAFYNCSSLTSITLPESVTSIGMECFSICTSLEQVTFLGDQLTILQTGAFSHCNALKEFDVPNGVTTILNACFYKCLGLTTIRLPDSIVELGTGALGGCAALTDIYMPDTDRELTLFENSFQGTPADQLTFHVRWGSSSWDWLRGDHPRMTDSTVVFDPVPLDDETVEVEVVDSPLYQYCMIHINPIIKVTRFGHQLSPHQQYTFSSTGNNINAGDASVEIVGEGLFTDGSFCGSRTISFTIKPAPLSDDTTMDPIGPFDWDGKKWEPVDECKFHHEFLPIRIYDFSPDEYTLKFSNSTDAGENTAIVTMTMKEGGNFTGSKSFTFSIAKRDLRNDGTIAGLNDYYPYTGEPVTPVPKVSVPDRTGKKPVSLEEKWGDFTISYANNVGWGTATLIIDTTGSKTLLEDKIEVPFEIRYPLKDDITIADIPDQTYTGEAITPEVTASAFGSVLPSSAYEVIALAGENVDVGVGTAVVRGRQAEWTVSKEFNIVPRRVTVTADDASKPYGAPDPELTATVGNAVPAQEVAYTLSREAGEEVGTYAITATGDEDQGNYLVSFGEAGTFTIERAKLDELVSVADVPDQVYRAEAIEPALSLTRTDTGAALEEGVDYEVSFKDNVEVGTASYTIKGIGNYQGELDGTFSIVALDVSDAQFSVPFQRYVEGERSEPHPEEVSVTLPDGEALVLSEGTHYSVSWERNDAPGTAMLTVTGIGSCTGSRTVPFEIRKLADLSYAQVAPIPDQVYDGQCPHPPLWVTLDDGLLIEGVDYEYDCYDSRVGTATAYLRGLGALEGTELQATFQIVPRDIADGEVEELGPQEWWGNYPRDIWPHLTVDGRDLAAWVEYTCTFKNNVEVGSIATVTLHGCGNYTGTTSTTFPIVAYQAIVLPDDASKEYGRGDPELTASLKWGLYGDDKVDYTLEREPGEDVGTYAITVTGERYQCDGHYELVTDATA
ncbi:MAG: leucine-rich repeat protein, partial [Atopobiaceae bacterium]|nr:leucine-rich repeat protein [Atopobiaceae bacterium]